MSASVRIALVAAVLLAVLAGIALVLLGGDEAAPEGVSAPSEATVRTSDAPPSPAREPPKRRRNESGSDAAEQETDTQPPDADAPVVRPPLAIRVVDADRKPIAGARASAEDS